MLPKEVQIYAQDKSYNKNPMEHALDSVVSLNRGINVKEGLKFRKEIDKLVARKHTTSFAEVLMNTKEKTKA